MSPPFIPSFLKYCLSSLFIAFLSFSATLAAKVNYQLSGQGESTGIQGLGRLFSSAIPHAAVEPGIQLGRVPAKPAVFAELEKRNRIYRPAAGLLLNPRLGQMPAPSQFFGIDDFCSSSHFNQPSAIHSSALRLAGAGSRSAPEKKRLPRRTPLSPHPNAGAS